MLGIILILKNFPGMMFPGKIVDGDHLNASLKQAQTICNKLIRFPSTQHTIKQIAEKEGKVKLHQ